MIPSWARRAGRFLGPLVAASFLVAACATDQIWVDGYPVGARATCDDGCRRFTAFAVAVLDDAAKGHPAVVDVEHFVPDYRGPNGAKLLTTRSGGRDLIVVLHLADGTVRAVYVGCGVGIDPDRCFLGPPTMSGGEHLLTDGD